jgi:hypothetical protein
LYLATSWKCITIGIILKVHVGIYHHFLTFSSFFKVF